MISTASIKIFLKYGDPKRLRTAEISNWTGKAIAAPRSDLDELLIRDELLNPGVYFLLGQDLDDGSLLAYIGEAETTSARIKQHKEKDFWNNVIVFVSKDENLTKSHIRYLEGAILERAKNVGRYKVENTQSSGAKLPESDMHEMQVFLEKISQLLPILGTDLLTPISSKAKQNTSGDIESTSFATEEILYLNSKNVKASGGRSPNGFVVLRGSQAVIDYRDSANPWVIKLKEDLIINNGLVKINNYYEFTKDIEFSSPSAAAAVIVGGNANGPKSWKNINGVTLKDLES